MADNNEIFGTMLFERAKKEYPYLSDKDISFMYSPASGNRVLEFYAPDEPGDPKSPRPSQLPMGEVGIQVFSPKAKPLDILGDYVSHYAVEKDPKLASLYSQFGQSLDPKMMQQRYQYHQQHFGEKRPYEQWLQTSGLPEMFRGYTFNQWPDAAKMYTPQQLQILDQVRQYLGIK